MWINSMHKKDIDEMPQHKSVLRTAIIPSAISKIIFLIVLFALAQFSFYSYVRPGVLASASRAFSQACQTSDILLESIFLYYENVFRVSMKQYRKDREYPAIDPAMISGGEADIIDTVYLYDRRTDTIYMDMGIENPDLFFQEPGENSTFIVRESQGTSEDEEKRVITLCIQDKNMPEEDKAVLYVNLIMERILDIFHGICGDRFSMSADIVPADCNAVFSSQKESVQSMSEVSGQSGTYIEKDSGGKYYIFRQKSKYFDACYVVKVRSGDLFLDVYLFDAAIISVLILLVIFEIVYAFILARKICVPLRRVVDHANLMISDNDNYRDEYELIDIVFSRLEAYASKMRITQYRYRQNERKAFLQRLLYGDGCQITQEDLNEMGIIWEGRIFCVVSVCLNHLETLKEKYSHSDMKLFGFTMVNILEEYLGNAGYTVYGVDNDNYSVSIIMQLEQEYEQSEEYLKETFPLENITKIQQLLYGAKLELEKIMSPVTVFVSVGRSVRKYEEIHRSWLDTQYATIYRFTRGDQLITLFTPHMESYESGIQYPWDIEKKLLSDIKAAKQDIILLTLEEFFEAIEKMAPDEMRWAINQIMTSIFRIGMANNYRMRDGSPLDWKSWVNELNATDTKYEMKDVLTRLILNLSMEDEENDSTRGKLAEQVKVYVDSHFCEDSLSVSEVASHMGYSVNYVRQIFKEMYGISASEYILEKRIDKARELLLTTNYTSKKIAQMVGYADNRYFYVVFKKKTGETAESFRKKKN